MVTERENGILNGTDRPFEGRDPVLASVIPGGTINIENSRPAIEKPSFFGISSFSSFGQDISAFNSNNGNGGNENDQDTMDEDFDDLEVVLSFKCRHCSFLCQEKKVLANHVKAHHRQQGGSNGVKRHFKLQIENGFHQLEDLSVGGLDELGSGVKGEHLLQNHKKNGVEKVELPPTPASGVPMTPEPEALAIDEDSVCVPENRVEGHEGRRDDGNDADDKSNADEGASMDDQIEDVFLCAECDIVFPSKEVCCEHMHVVHDLTQFSADFIQEEIISKKPDNAKKQLPKRRQSIRPPRHLTEEGGAIVPKRYRVTKEIFFTCSKCPIKFESNEVTKFHEQCHAKTLLGDEEIRNANGKPIKSGFVCPVCESKDPDTAYIFAAWGLCAGHLWREHKIDCELYTCSICKQFKSPLITKVKDHELVHSSQTVFVCKTCNKTFKQKKQLRSHEKYHKENNTILPPPQESRWYTPKECHICKRILSDAKCLKKHISAVHNKLKPYSCHICGHTTARKAELQLHVRQHTGEKPYKCTQCPFATGDHNSLRKHKWRHSDKRPYVCPYCEYRCIQSCAFKKHILSFHPGQEVVFLCQLCSHASVNEGQFAAHQKDHADGRLPIESQNEPILDSPEAHDSEAKDGPIQSSSPTPNCTVQGPKKLSKPSWLEEDSLDIVDTGGVTIPASPANPEPDGKKTPGSEDANDQGILTKDSVGGHKGIRNLHLATVFSTQNGSLGTFSLTTSNSLIQAHQPTFVLLSPNGLLPLPLLSSVVASTTNTTSNSVNLNHIGMDHICEDEEPLNLAKDQNGNGNLISQDHASEDPDDICSKEGTDNFTDIDTASSSCLLDKDSLSISTRALSPLINTTSSQLLENIHLDSLDLAEVMNSSNPPSMDDSNMFERLLGMSDI